MAAQAEFTAALDRLVEHDYVRLVRAVALFSGTMEGAEDAVQEALAWALEHSRKGRHIDCLEAWVVSTAFDHLRTRFRRAARRRERGDGPDPPSRRDPMPRRSVRSCSTSGRRFGRCPRGNARPLSCTTTWINPSARSATRWASVRAR
jgi:DNA-directed RNA polymerase specialized sigma24 family protein